MEFIQVTQTAPDKPQIGLVATKATVMRVFVKQKNRLDDPFHGITSQVKFDGGPPVSLASAIPDPLASGEQVTAHETVDRTVLSGSLNYLLPRGRRRWKSHAPVLG